MKRIAFVVVLIALAFPVLAVGQHMAIGQEQQINVLHGWPGEIDGSIPSYVKHGLFVEDQELEESGFNNARDYLVWRMAFTLWVDGVLTQPTRIAIEHFDVAESPYGVAGWSCGWVFMFSAGFFEGGPHLFEGEWIYLDGSGSIFRAHTVNVVYPAPPGPGPGFGR